jgi:hypothetical protein
MNPPSMEMIRRAKSPPILAMTVVLQTLTIRWNMDDDM